MRSSSWKLLVFVVGVGAVWLVRQQIESQDEKMRAETRTGFEKQEAGEEHGLTPGQVVQLRWDQGQEFERHNRHRQVNELEVDRRLDGRHADRP